MTAYGNWTQFLTTVISKLIGRFTATALNRPLDFMGNWLHSRQAGVTADGSLIDPQITEPFSRWRDEKLT